MSNDAIVSICIIISFAITICFCAYVINRIIPSKKMLADAQAKYNADKKQLKDFSNKQLLDEINNRLDS